MNIFDFFKAINHKDDLMKDDPQSMMDYNPSMMNQLLSQYADALLYVNEMNLRSNHCDSKLQFNYFFHSLKKGDRNIQRWMVSESYLNDSDIDLVKEYYNYSTSKAKTALDLLSDDELEYIRKRSFKGGVSSYRK